MNDFTKEELEQIKFDMEMGLTRFDASFTDEMYLDLKTKIQSMIDNYCDHLWTDGSGNNIFCAKCHILGGKR